MLTRAGLCSILLLFPLPIFAWSSSLHQLIGYVAYQRLAPSDQTRVAQLGRLLFPGYQAPAYVFARAGTLPDRWRDQTLASVFQSYNAVMPPALKPYANASTKQWHYINQSFGHACRAPSPPNVVWAMTLLRQAWSQTAPRSRARAVVMAFWVHLIGDATQPLHVITRVTPWCGTDAGGNQFCLQRRKRCRLNLHQLWDRGFYFFSFPGRGRYARGMARLEAAYPMQQFRWQGFAPAQWVEKTFARYTPWIYVLPEYQLPNETYFQRGKRAAMRQVSLASMRINHIFSEGVFD